jgi:hypothetical protein
MSGATAATVAKGSALGSFGALGPFIENRGQLGDQDVRLYAQGRGVSVLFRAGGVDVLAPSVPAPGGTPAPPAASIGTTCISLRFLGCAPVAPAGEGPMGCTVSHFLGADPSRWVGGAPAFSGVVYRGLYEGVDVRFRFKDGALKYDIEAVAGADVGWVRFAYEGAEGVVVDAATGDLLVRTPIGTLRDARPVAFQPPGSASGVPCDYRLLGGCAFGFSLPPSCAPGEPLVIDPGIEVSTLLGGSANDDYMNVAMGPDGDVYLLGRTLSVDLPVTGGAFMGAPAGDYDVFLARIAPDLATLRFLTYFGGSGDDGPVALGVAPDGAVYVLGGTESQDLPIPAGPSLHRTALGDMDIFLARFSGDGSELLGCTYFGGSAYDGGRSLLIDAQGDVLVGGWTLSSDLGTTAGALQRTKMGGADTYEVLVARISGDLGSLINCTYLGGSGDDHGALLRAGKGGQLVVAGRTRSPDFPTTADALCRSRPSGGELYDAFVTVLDPSLGQILHSTYLGWSGEERFQTMLVAGDGSVVVAGDTNSTDLPLSGDPLAEVQRGGTDVFLAQMDANLTRLDYLALLGGEGDDSAGEAHWGPQEGTLYLAGATGSRNMTWTRGAFDYRERGGKDLFLTEVDLAAHRVTYSTFMGGADEESWVWYMMEVDAAGRPVIAAATMSDDFPVTPGAAWPTRSGGWDGALLRLDPSPCGAPPAPANLTATGTDGAVHLAWDPLPFDGCRFDYVVHAGASEDPNASSLMATVDWGSPTCTVSPLVNGRTYHFWVTAISSAGEGPLSDMATAVPMRPPSMPLLLRAETGSRAVTVRWSPPMDTGGSDVVAYRVYRGDAPGDLVLHDTVGNVTSYEDLEANVTCGRQYVYAVSAVNARGEGPPSDTEAVVPMGPPSAPRGLRVEEGDVTVSLRWEAPANDGGLPVLGYRVLVWDAATGPPVRTVGGVTQLAYDDAGLSNGRHYWYQVVAYTAFGEGDPTARLSASPYTFPSAPRNLKATPGNRQITLSWSPPLSDGGRPVLGYMLHFGESPDALVSTTDMGNATTRVLSGLNNGDTYYLSLTAYTVAAGEGPGTVPVSARPMGLPSSVEGLVASSTAEGLLLSWLPPADTGGSRALTYKVLRGPLGGGPVALATTDLTSHLDRTAVPGETYLYRVVAENEQGQGPGAVVQVEAHGLPGEVRDLHAAGGDRAVSLTWSPSASTGGVPVTDYIVSRGLTASLLNEVARVRGTNFTDVGLANGGLYYYTVVANNSVGAGSASAPASATPLGPPGPPLSLGYAVQAGHVVLTWQPPSGYGIVPATGYEVLRGRERAGLEVVASLGANASSYKDTTAQRGGTYYYTVRAISRLGAGTEAPALKVSVKNAPNMLLLVVGLVVAVAVAGGAVQAWRRSRAAARAIVPSTTGEQVVVDVSGASAGPVEAVAAEGPTYIVEEVLLLYRDGALIADRAREDSGGRDMELLSGLLIAIQSLIQDGMDREGALQGIKHGDNEILIAAGIHASLAAVIYGRPDGTIGERLEETMRWIETAYAGVIEDWDGDPAAFEGAGALIAPLLESTASLTRQDVAGVMAPKEVSVLSSVDFHRGYVRLKVAAVNYAPDAILDATIDVRYDPDMLRLERVEPFVLRLRGDRVTLGNVRPGERKTVAFLFDPQICQSTQIDGGLSYYDPKGGTHRVEMKRRQAEVVCPIFFTKEHANTAMLRRLIKDLLTATDMRVLSYPAGLPSRELLSVGKAVMGLQGVQLVREFMEEGPPLEAEVWYYGETKVKGYQIVIRFGVVEGKHALELFAASTAMEPVTGLLAELRRELVRALGERFEGNFEPERDESVQAELGRRPLMLERDVGDGPGP